MMYTDVLGADAESVVIGHSSGAVAGLRLAERTRLHGLVVVSVTPSDLVRAALSAAFCQQRMRV